MSIVPYREVKRQRRRTLDRAQVVRAALTLLDEVGLEELTMRRLSDKLGVKAASLYRHVRNKEELLQLLADEISGQIPTGGSGGTWQKQVMEMARNARHGLLAHRDAAQLLAMTAPFGPQRLRHIEWLLHVLRAAGLSGRDAARAAYHFNNLVTEFVADEARFASMTAQSASSRKKMYAEVRKQFKSLPPSDYPTVVELADDLADDDADGLFEFGIEVWLNGLTPLARRR